MVAKLILIRMITSDLILIVFHLFRCSKHKLSTILKANVASLTRFVMLTLIQNINLSFVCVFFFYLFLLFTIELTLLHKVGMNMAK